MTIMSAACPSAASTMAAAGSPRRSILVRFDGDDQEPPAEALGDIRGFRECSAGAVPFVEGAHDRPITDG